MNSSNPLLNWDIDRYLNPWIPHSRLNRLPKPVSHFLGHRSSETKEPPAALQWPITFLATVAGLCLVGGITNYAPGIVQLHGPPLIASLGASAVLDFNAIKTPLAQPRNSVFGNTLSAIIGVAISKLFQLNPAFARIDWVSGAVGCAAASLVMSLTNTIHPPGGATAVLASINPKIVAMGWWFPPIILMHSSLLVCVALLFNNVLRQYPTFWWTPLDVGRKLRQARREEQQNDDGGEAAKGEEENPAKAESDASSDRTLHRERSNSFGKMDGTQSITISPTSLNVPPHVTLSSEEADLLEKLQRRMRTYV